MIALVTGVAGFIASTLAERLVGDGWTVRGIDSFTPYYPVSSKRRNLRALALDDTVDLIEDDLLTCDVDRLVDGVDVVFHQAAQPGVRQSWSTGFTEYVRNNVDATQRLLEAARGTAVSRFVYASSSSVYGNVATSPTDEDQPTRPHSPYGVTKLAGEHLCRAYAENFGLPTVALRYFTVYGPRQRPDMAIHRLIEAALDGSPFRIFGDGTQIRDFTFVDDVVDANVRAARAEVSPGTIVNVAGGSSISLAALIDLVGEAVGTPVPVEREPAQPGDVRRTGGAIDRAGSLLGWRPRVDLAEGVKAQVAWHRERRSDRP